SFIPGESSSHRIEPPRELQLSLNVTPFCGQVHIIFPASLLVSWSLMIYEASQHPMSGGFDLNLILDDPIEENHSATNENTATSSTNLGILQG
ncbi:hypothetical protein LINPERHAP2_LOCUS16402, partial [Linum perenne]